MLSYYLFMALLIFTLVLWAIIALRDDTPKEKRKSKPPAGAVSGPETKKKTP